MFFRRRNKRTEVRLPVEESATVTVLNTMTPAIGGILVDLSPSGAGLRLGEFVMRGLTVDVRWREGALRGRVQYCRPLPVGGYKVGLRIDQINLGA